VIGAVLLGPGFVGVIVSKLIGAWNWTYHTGTGCNCWN
jgi:hypothetical protein